MILWIGFYEVYKVTSALISIVAYLSIPLCSLLTQAEDLAAIEFITLLQVAEFKVDLNPL